VAFSDLAKLLLGVIVELLGHTDTVKIQHREEQNAVKNPTQRGARSYLSHR
jgi:hypothetical protein